jgi:hypothetical protein
MLSKCISLNKIKICQGHTINKKESERECESGTTGERERAGEEESKRD